MEKNDEKQKLFCFSQKNSLSLLNDPCIYNTYMSTKTQTQNKDTYIYQHAHRHTYVNAHTHRHANIKTLILSFTYRSKVWGLRKK